MSHELRTPLNAILGLSEGLLEESYGGVLSDRQKKAITTIERSGKHLLDLINDILDLAKIESGKIELQITSVSVQHLCNASLTFVKQMADKKKVRLITQISTETNTILVDERRMCQALINLLSNAVKFTPEGGQVTLAVQPDLARQHLCLSVSDTGIGIASENISKLFQSFVQIDSRLNRQYTGTGLGLALVRRIVELHDGVVTVESEVGQGSHFTIHVPYRQCNLGQCNLRSYNLGQCDLEANPLYPSKSAAPIAPSSSISSIVSTKHTTQGTAPLILLAEDNEITQEIISEYLSARGYQLVIATNGLEAIQQVRTSSPQLILMDLQMPQMDGLTAIQQIRADWTLAQVPIVALTALAMAGDREKCLAMGATYYMTKPVRLKQLLALIQKSL